MKKLILILSILAAAVPVTLLANHLDGTWSGYGSNYISFGVGNQPTRYSHSGNVAFVDEHGGTVDYHTLQQGHPITVDYAGRHGHEVVRRVIVHQRRARGHHHHGH